MIDKMLAVGSTFDWITPLWAMYKRVKHNAMDFVVPVGQLNTVGELAQIIDVWAIQIVGDDLVFTARAADEDIVNSFLN